MSILQGPQPTNEPRSPYRQLPFDPIIDKRQRDRIWTSRPHLIIGGYRIVEWPDLRFDEVRLDRTSKVALVGELKQVLYESDMDRLKKTVRVLIQSDLRATLSAFAERWGVAYPLEDR